MNIFGGGQPDPFPMKFSNLGIRSKLMLGISLLLLGYMGTIATGFYQGAEREKRFSQIKDVNVPLSKDTERIVFAYESTTKAYEDASMVGDGDMVKEAGKKLLALASDFAKTNELANTLGLLEENDKAVGPRLTKLQALQAETFALVSNDGSKEEIKRKTEALTAETGAVRKLLGEIAKHRTEEVDAALTELAEQTRFQRKFDLIIGCTIILISCVLVYLIMQKGVVDHIDGVVANLRDSAGRLDGATGTIRASSHSLAEGASTQAASLEETSATLEEISGMARRNAENSQQAKDRMGAAQAAAAQGLDDVKAMTAAMGEIKAASDNIAKIVKAIDEIAFQTNILALNAAVEAARAGEAGAGFAVVAEEVRNLAQRSAQAARETAELIEDSIGKSERGARMSDKVATSLSQINTQVADVHNLIVEIAQASQEQSSGVSQVNTAVVQLDKLTQSNAATAEESAAAVQELAAQSRELHGCLEDLARVVYGAAHANEAVAHAHEHGGSHHHAAGQTIKTISGETSAFTPQAKAQPTKTTAKAVSPAKVQGKVIAPAADLQRKADDFFSS